MGLFSKNDANTRIANALERLVELYTLDLNSRGVATEVGDELGEVFLTDEAWLLRREQEDELRRTLGLAPGQPLGVIDPATGREWAAASTPPQEARPAKEELFPGSSTSWGFGVGPEGAEEAEPGTEEERDHGRGTPPATARQDR